MLTFIAKLAFLGMVAGVFFKTYKTYQDQKKNLQDIGAYDIYHLMVGNGCWVISFVCILYVPCSCKKAMKVEIDNDLV